MIVHRCRAPRFRWCPAWFGLLPVALAGLLVVLLAGVALAGPTTYRNAKGQVVGRKDAAGRFVDAKGNVRGREDAKGRFYDQKGRLRGQKTRDTGTRIRQQPGSGK